MKNYSAVLLSLAVLSLNGLQPAWAQMADSDVRIVPGTKWVASVTLDRGKYVSCQVTMMTNSAELRFTIGSKGSLVILLRDKYQERAISDVLGWGAGKSYRSMLFFDASRPIGRQAVQVGRHTLLIRLAGLDQDMIFNTKKIAIAVGGISMRGYDVGGLSLARRELFACYAHHGHAAAPSRAAAAPWIGTWAAKRSWCEPGPDRHTVVITENGVSALENACRYTSISKRGPKWFLQADCFSEGTQHRETYVYEMKGQSLLVTFPQGDNATVRFVRCR